MTGAPSLPRQAEKVVSVQLGKGCVETYSNLPVSEGANSDARDRLFGRNVVIGVTGKN